MYCSQLVIDATLIRLQCVVLGDAFVDVVVIFSVFSNKFDPGWRYDIHAEMGRCWVLRLRDFHQPPSA